MMTDDTHGKQRRAGAPSAAAATVTHLASRRRTDDVLGSMTFVFGGVNYGTVPISAPYTKGKPIVLYIVPRCDEPGTDRDFAGPLDCLVTDDVSLGSDLEVAR